MGCGYRRYGGLLTAFACRGLKRVLSKRPLKNLQAHRQVLRTLEPWSALDTLLLVYALWPTPPVGIRPLVDAPLLAELHLPAVKSTHAPSMEMMTCNPGSSIGREQLGEEAPPQPPPCRRAAWSGSSAPAKRASGRASHPVGQMPFTKAIEAIGRHLRQSQGGSKTLTPLGNARNSMSIGRMGTGGFPGHVAVRDGRAGRVGMARSHVWCRWGRRLHGQELRCVQRWRLSSPRC